MQNIHVRRYQTPSPGGFQGSVEPEDRSWVIFIDKDGHATFWRRGQIEPDPELVAQLGAENVEHHILYDVEDAVSSQAALATGAFGG